MALPFPPEWAAAVERLAPALLNAAAGSVAVLGLAGLASLAMRRASAAARHGVWLLGFAGVLLLPVLSAALPGWHVLPRVGMGRPAPPRSEPAPMPPVPAPSVPPTPVASPPLPEAPQEAPLPADPTPHKETTMNATTALPSAGSPQAPLMSPVAPAQLDLPVSPTAAGPAPAARPGQPQRAAWLPWLLLCWPLGSLLVLGRVALGHASLWRLRRRCAAVTRGELFDLLGRLRREIGLRRPVELLTSPLRTMPMTWGLLWRARLLVPEQAAAWPAAQRRDVLLHELGHVKRWDCLTHLLSQAACALYWFNPLAWAAARRMQVERERACDDLVLNRGAAAPAYARHLLASVSSAPAPRLAGAAVAMARPSTLEERVRAILDGGVSRRGVTARGGLAAALLLLAALVPVASLKAQQGPAATPAAAQEPSAAGGPAAAPARGGSDGSAESPAATRPAATPPAGRPGFAGSRFPRPTGFGGGGPPVPAVGEGPSCTLDATIYDVRLPVDQIGRLDVDALAKASATAEAFEKALAALGTAKPMYRASQSVRLSGDTITIGSEVPVVTNSRMTDKGQTINSIQYQSTGALFTLAGRTGVPGGVDLDLRVEVSSASDGGPAIADKVTAPVMRKATLAHKGPFQPGKPFVVVSVDAGSADKEGKAVAYIARITMGEPQPPAPK